MTHHITILTGAGISAGSGIPTFRDVNGLWENHRVEDVASPDGYRRDPDLVHRFYDLRRRAAMAAVPNAAHRALARLEAEYRDRELGTVTVITQNVDTLHERAGSTGVIHMHGQLDSALCESCGSRHHWEGDLSHRPPCPQCGRQELRPDIVWFGENVYRMGDIAAAVERCNLFVVIGTSGQVAPASFLAYEAAEAGARTLLLNLEHSDGIFDESRYGPAVDLVPAWVDEILAGTR